MAEYELETFQEVAAHRELALVNTAVTLEAGTKFKVQSRKSGETTELLEEEVPAGKVWKLTFTVRVTEENE